jgi:hypothetical protein
LRVVEFDHGHVEDLHGLAIHRIPQAVNAGTEDAGDGTVFQPDATLVFSDNDSFHTEHFSFPLLVFIVNFGVDFF